MRRLRLSWPSLPYFTMHTRFVSTSQSSPCWPEMTVLLYDVWYKSVTSCSTLGGRVATLRRLCSLLFRTVHTRDRHCRHNTDLTVTTRCF